MKLNVILGDITKQDTEAIVNPANKSLLGGGGVDGAIHRTAGPNLLEECRTLGGCKTGEAKITKGYNLKAKFVIHTVGPIYGAEKGKEAELLRSCYLNSLKLASEKGIKSISFPSISTGAFRYPKKEACEIAVKTCMDFNENNSCFNEIRFVVFDNDSLEIYAQELAKYQKRKMKVLFVCMSNIDRSPCAEEILNTIPGFEAKSAGVGPFAETQINSISIKWADVIVCMESLHRDILCKKFPEAYEKDIRIWNISNSFCRGDPELKKMLWGKIREELWG